MLGFPVRAGVVFWIMVHETLLYSMFFFFVVTTWICCCISGLLLGVCYSHLKPWGGLSCKKAALLGRMDKTLSCPLFPFWSGAFAVMGQTAPAPLLPPGVCRRGTEGSLRTGFPFQNVISFTISVSVYLKGTVTYWNAAQWGWLGLMLHVSLASLVHNDAFWKKGSASWRRREEMAASRGCTAESCGPRGQCYIVWCWGWAWKHKDLSVLQAYLAFEWTKKKFHLFSGSVDEALFFFPGLAASICMWCW